MYKLLNVVWEITLSCNINCLHCGSSANVHKRPNELTTQEALSLIEQLADLKCKRVILSGGEPFMRKDWSILAQRLVDLGVKCDIISNGTIINDDIIDILERIGVNYLMFSLDGATAKTHDYIRGKEGVFNHLMEVIDKLKKRNFFVANVTTVHKGNIGELDDIKKLVLDKHVDVWQLQTANIRGRMPKEWALNADDYYNLAKYIAENRQRYKGLLYISEADCIGYYSKLTPDMGLTNWRGCNAGINTIGIESDGTIIGCLSMQEDIEREGNIREKSLKEIWNNPDNFKYNRRFDLSQLGGICADCKYGGICRGGCTERAITYTGQKHCQPYCLYDMEKNGLR